MKKLFYLSAIMFVFASFVACTTESMEEAENLQVLEVQSSSSATNSSSRPNSMRSSGSSSRPMSAQSNVSSNSRVQTMKSN
ncbi:hypothetical protein [Flagellimonas flava]|uniref:hypothetical protein n=1 Tax=Flagellimonas flava TaxID=570519 RepID=UPI000934601F|nr:hypothetical protein [Allomuricauda flava]